MVQFDFNLLFLLLPNPAGNEQTTKRMAYKGKTVMLRISLKHLAHITMYKQVLDLATDWGLRHLTIVLTASVLAKQPGLCLKHRDLFVFTCQIGLTMRPASRGYCWSQMKHEGNVAFYSQPKSCDPLQILPVWTEL